MKKLVSFKHFVIALAMTFAGLATFSACQDKNFDWDDAHASAKQEKFTNVFIKEFGQPDPNHQWGFDYASSIFETYSGSETRAIGDGVSRIYKQDMTFTPYLQKQFIENDGVFDLKIMEKPQNILAGEHHDVYAWFSNHRVHWAVTPCWYDRKDTDDVDNNGKTDELCSRWCYSDMTNTKISTSKVYAYYEPEPAQQTEAKTYTSGFDTSKFCANTNYSTENTINFTNGWIQHVAYDYTLQSADNGSTSKYTSVNMNKLGVKDIGNSDNYHTNDFNAGSGYGWKDQGTLESVYSTNGRSSSENAPKYPEYREQNGLLDLGYNFNDVVWSSSAGSGAYHNKFLIVHLEGTDPASNTKWSGYYLGLDFESYDTNSTNANSIVSADGWCNDWIIKIGDAGVMPLDKFRIMCEDLGDPQNVNSGLSTSDIDYNDIVVDVEPMNSSVNSIKLTLQAAGGTLPLTLWYDNTPLFETHELLQKGKIIASYDNRKNIIHEGQWGIWSEVVTEENVQDTERSNDVDYSTMHNTHSGKGKVAESTDSKSIVLVFNSSSPNIGDFLGKLVDLSASGKFNLNKLKIKVYRNGVDDYKTQSNFSDAEWIELANKEGEAPIMFYVPIYNYAKQEVLWMNEYNNIKLGYSGFPAWVTDKTKPFWEPSVDSTNQYLYPNSNPTSK